MKLRKGDTVQMIAGASRGKTGKVLRVDREAERVVVEGLNLRKKHVRPRKSGQKGQVIEFPASVHASNVQLVCPKCGKVTRVGFQLRPGEKKRRICRKCKQGID